MNAQKTLNKGNELLKLGRYEKALAAYEQAIRLAPNDANAYTNKGSVLMQLGRPEESEQAYQKGRELSH